MKMREHMLKISRLRELLTAGCSGVWIIILYEIIIIVLGSVICRAFFAAVVAPVLLYGIWRLFHKKILLPDRFPYTIAWWVLCVVGTSFMVWFAYSVRVEGMAWDWGKLIHSASEYVLTGDMKDEIYFSMYPNNQFWYWILILLFRTVYWFNPTAQLEQFYLASIAMGCVMVTGAIILLYMTAKILWGKKKAFVTACMAYMCLPLYMWALYAYTDTSGMFLLMLLLFLYVKAEKSKKTWQYALYMGGVGLTAAIAWKIKVTVFIFVIAVIITRLFKKLCWKRALAGMLSMMLFFIVGMAAANAGINSVFVLDEETYDRYEFPLTHWVMMSLQRGGYMQEDVDFTARFPTYNQKQDANIKEIEKRLEKRGILGNIHFFLYNKQMYTWGDSTFAGCEYLSREPADPDGFLERFVTTKGDLNWLLQIYTSIYYIILLAGMFLSAFYARKKREDMLFVGRLTMTGISIFLVIWECNPRYLVVFLPLMILLCAEGYQEMRKQIIT